MPDGTELSDNEASSPWTILPPSFGSRRSYFHAWNPVPLPDISTSYFILAAVSYSVHDTSARSSIITTVATEFFDFIPYTETPPPIHIDSFPDEFTLNATEPLYKRLLGGKIGTVTITTQEPGPLVYATSNHAMASTDCMVHLDVDLDLADLRHLQSVMIEVIPVIRAKTYYSSEKITSMPKHSEVGNHGPLYLHNDLVELDGQEFRNFQWTFSPTEETSTHALDDHKMEGTLPSAHRSTTSRLSFSQSEPESLPREARKESTWSTSIRVPITPLHRLPPSFYSYFIARSYTVLLKVKFQGLSLKNIYTEIPLQVVYPRPSTLPLRSDDIHLMPVSNTERFDGSCVGPTEILSHPDVSFRSGSQHDGQQKYCSSC